MGETAQQLAAAWNLDKFVCSCEPPGQGHLSPHGIWHPFTGYCLFAMMQLGRYFIAVSSGEESTSPAFP